MSFLAFQRHAADARRRADATDGRVVVPVVRRRSADLTTPVAAFLALREDAAFPFLLESVEGGEKLARYSFLGKDPYRVVRANGRSVEITERREGVVVLPDELSGELPGGATPGDIFDTLRALTAGYTAARVPGLPRLSGGAVGYLGYDAVRLLEDLPDPPGGGLDLPDAVWGFYDRLVAFDHARHQVVLIQNAFLEPTDDLRAAYDAAQSALDVLETNLHQPAPTPESVTLADAQHEEHAPPSTVSREAFENAVRTAKKHIRAGDIFQVVLSQRLAMPFGGDRFNLYRALRQVNPSPYLFYLDFDDFALAGASPEVLVRVEPPAADADAKGEASPRAELLPIAGTRPRGADAAEDQSLADELSADEKERAEHLMLVDLGRNDLARVCRAGTVEVERYAFVERYSHVMHLVSEVAGRLRAGQDAVGALRAAFPAGTVSGAPKVRAMQLIDALEGERRGVYAGAVGHLGFDGALDTCIAIRTMVVKGRTAYVQAGAGIVADSDPTPEYEETLNKARALREAVRVAAEELF